MRSLMLITLALAIGCGDKTDDTGEPDGDGDGYGQSEDCDDTDPDINPGVDERCNGVDDDCNGEIDEEGAIGSDTFYADTDGDTYGDESNTIDICELPDGYVVAAYDCDDTRADVNPAADELCDGDDNDCDGSVDEDASDATVWYADDDDDGYGDENSSVEACDEPSGHVDNSDDCDDSDSGRSPDADEYCDEIDNNCDGHIDEDTAVDTVVWYGDADGDGYGTSAAVTTACEQPDDHVDNADDCLDSDDAINPAADELCDNVDNDCNGDIDEEGAIDAPTWYADNDGDTFGDPASSTLACDQPSGHVSNSDDCDDTQSAVNPRGTEICDGVDNDCDGDIDAEGLVTLDGTTNYGAIGQAVRNATSGGSVMVCDGTYVENVEIDKDITLASLNGSGSTTIDGDGAGACIEISAGVASVTGFTVTDGSGAGHPEIPSTLVGGGIMILGTDAVVLDDMVFLSNEADFGAGLFGSEGCTLSMSNSTFDLNDAEYSGGAMYLWDCTASFVSVIIEDNFATWGGGVYTSEGQLDLDQCTFEDNYATEDGGGIYVGVDAVVTATADTLLTGNTATNSGGGLRLDTGAIWTGGEAYDNEADFGGGFFSYTDGSAANAIDDLLCEFNSADTSGGCGYVYGELTITGSQILDNGAYWGGGLFLEDSTTYVVNSTVEENIVNYNGGGVYIIDGSALWSVSSDWGTGTTDNDPDDVYVDGGSNAYNGYGTGETFSCSDTLGTCS